LAHDDTRQEPGPTLDPETLDPSTESVEIPYQRRMRSPGAPLSSEAPAAPRPAEARARKGGLSADGRLRTGKLAGLSMNRAIWVLSWPILIESLLNSMVGLTDTVLAAGLEDGAAATDAIGGASYITWFIGLIIMAIGIGATALISRSVGGGRQAVANAVVGQTMILGVGAGVVTGLAIWLSAPSIADVLNMGEVASAQFVEYLRVLSWSVPFMGILFGGTACARGAGDSKRPLVIMVIVNGVNMFASWVLAGVDLTSTHPVNGELVTRTLVANPFGFDMGVQGIALGTLLANIVGAMIMVLVLVRGSSGVALRRRRLVPHWHTIRRLVRIGLPNFVETLGLWVGNFIIILMVGWLTATAGGGLLGVHVVAIRIEAFSFLPGFAMGMAAATLAGQFLGAGSAPLAKRAVWRCVLMAIMVMGGFGMLFVAIPAQIVGLFTPQPVHLALAPGLIMIAGFVQVPFAIAIVTRSAMRGAGDVRVVLILTWVTTYLVRLPLAYALSGVDIPLGAGRVLANPFGFEPSLWGLWLGLCIEMAFRGVLFLARFLHGGWTRIKV
jgi:putative MATE family efflux protein